MRANDLEADIKRSKEGWFQKTEFADEEYENRDGKQGFPSLPGNADVIMS
jgi:hypothetical protein